MVLRGIYQFHPHSQLQVVVRIILILHVMLSSQLLILLLWKFNELESEFLTGVGGYTSVYATNLGYMAVKYGTTAYAYSTDEMSWTAGTFSNNILLGCYLPTLYA